MFREAPYLISAASVAGSKEADGPIGKLFDVTDKDDLFGAQTWEEAESNMQKEACVLAAGKAHVDLKKIRYLFGGDLLRQGIATSMGVEALQIPMFGLYGACSTSGEALALASMSAAAGYGGTMIAVTSSHFGSAEKEFRFPLGYANTEGKLAETKKALEDGAEEIDMVINICDVKNGAYHKVEEEIRLLKEATGDKILKVIIETCYLTKEEKIAMCHAVTNAGADFIKTSTGFGTAGATMEDVLLMKEHIGAEVKIKAAGGIRTKEDMENYIKAGCSRLGTSSAVDILG